jgi:hypothetical protein
MNKIVTILFMVVLALFACAGEVRAAGVGVYGTIGGGRMNYALSNIIGTYNAIAETMSGGCGFIADTNLGNDRLFNYRFRAGYEYQKTDSGIADHYQRVQASNIFGFGVYHHERVRVWVGPQIGIGYQWGNNRYYRYSNISVNGVVLPMRISDPAGYFGIHIGMAAGVNVAITPVISIPVECGFRYTLWVDLRKGQGAMRAGGFTAMGPEGYAALGVMYRFNENVPDVKGPVNGGTYIRPKGE